MCSAQARGVVGIGFLLVAFLLACALPPIEHEYELSPGREFGATMKTALLLPLNETVDVPDGLEPGEAATTELMIAHLESKGLRVEQVSADDYTAAASQAARLADRARRSGQSQSTSETISFSEVIPHLLDALESNASLVVAPNMVIRTGEFDGGKSAKWDGVRRRQPGTRGGMTGDTSVASLFVVIYNREGTRIFSGYGGLDMLFEISHRKKRMVLIEDRLQDEGNLRQGVCIAFHPFFGLEERCR